MIFLDGNPLLPKKKKNKILKADAYCVLYWQLAAILPLALVHTLGNLFTNMSLGKVAVSFTHTIKATEPFFSVLLSAMFLGEVCWIWIQIKLISRDFVHL